MSRYDDFVLTPTPHHGWLRTSCDNTWFLWMLLVVMALVGALMWRQTAAWSVLAVLGITSAFVMSVAFAEPHESDREAISRAALFVVTVVAFVGILVVGVALFQLAVAA